jgi:hypothetical protein
MMAAMNPNWKPSDEYTRPRFGVDALVVIECVAFLLVGLAAAWLS